MQGKSEGPSGSEHGSIAKGLTINEEDFSKLENGHNETWYHQKARLLLHLTSDIHHRSLIHNRKVSSVISNRKRIVINQLRTAIGIIKSKSSALQYEERIAELYAAGAAVGNLGHSRKLFPDMAAVAVAYIRQKCAEFLSTPLPSTGFPPHFYVTADKSTNHRETNQITLVCPVVNGERQGIVASVDLIYVTSDGIGGGAAELATTLLAGVASLKFSPDLLQMQGKVLDGQYLNNRFINTINEAILSPFDLTNSTVSEEVWRPFQWDPSHWLDKVFSKFKGCAFVDRILKRSNLYHQLFGHGKMHSLVTAMSREQSLPMKVTSAFAHQRFLSSSYLSLKNLQESLEIYIDAFKDHDNREEMGYKIYGVDFVTDLLGLLDLLKPITIVMTQVQAHWCPGWKLHSFVPCVIQQLKKFKSSLQNESDRLSDACPLLSQHLPKLDSMKYGDCELVEGWLIVGEVKPGMPVRWEARDRKDCFRDLRDLANGMLMELETRFAKCCPPLLKLLSQCLDFETIVKQLCGERIDGNQPVNRRKLAAAGLKEFTKCVEFICELPHIKDANLDIGPEFASAIFWGIKSTLLEVIWGDLFEKYFSLFFVKWNPNCTKTAAVPVHNATIRIRKFMPVTSDSFSLFAPFEVVLESGREFVVRLDEKRLINSLYTDPQFFGAVGREFCVVFDVMYAKTGTEAIAESFYRVMEKQQMDGGQSFEVLKNRTIVDWSLPHTVQCDNALSQMASMYIYGAKEHGIKKHYVSVSNSRPSKVVSRLMRDVPNLPFLV